MMDVEAAARALYEHETRYHMTDRVPFGDLLPGYKQTWIRAAKLILEAAGMPEMEAQLAAIREAANSLLDLLGEYLENVIYEGDCTECHWKEGTDEPQHKDDCFTGKFETWLKEHGRKFSSTAGRDLFARLQAADRLCKAAETFAAVYRACSDYKRVTETTYRAVIALDEALREWKGAMRGGASGR